MLPATAVPSGADSTAQSTPPQTAIAVQIAPDTTIAAGDEATPAPAPVTSAAASKNNNTIWKAYMDSVASTVKTEVLSSKKIKRGDYAVLVTYTIGTDGQTTISDVALTPENTYLQQQIKTRLDTHTPRLSPVLNSAGTPRKAIKKHSFTVTKD